MRLIHGPLTSPPEGLVCIALKVDRLRLAKRRWRGFAEDGSEFGFDLESPLPDRSVFFADDSKVYSIEQQPEAVIEIQSPPDQPSATRLGWVLGNLHFPIQILEQHIRIVDDAAVRQMLLREGIPHQLTEAVFVPFSNAQPHGA